MKRQKDRTLKDELPRSIGTQYATGNQWRNNSRKNEGISVVSVVLEKTLESPLDCKEIQPVHSEGVQPWDFFGRTDTKVETPILWPPDAKSWLIGKYSDAGRNWGQEEKGTTQDEMAGWHHWLNGRESEWTLGVGNGQGGLVCCNSWGHKELDMTEQMNWTELKWLSRNSLVFFGRFLPIWTNLVAIIFGSPLSTWRLMVIYFFFKDRK